MHTPAGIFKEGGVRCAVSVFGKTVYPVSPASAAAQIMIYAFGAVLVDYQRFVNKSFVLFIYLKRFIIVKRTDLVTAVAIKIAGVNVTVCLNGKIVSANAAH